MKMAMYLTKEEVQEAILEYIKRFRPDFVKTTLDLKKVPTIRLTSMGKEIELFTAEVEQHMDVHSGPHPYR